MYSSILLGIGIVLLWSLVTRVILPSVLLGSLSSIKKYNKSGKAWAVVTGTTSGIGAAFVKVLGELGFNIMMIARSEEKLKEIKAQLASTVKNVKVECLVIDLSKRDILTPELMKFIAGNEIGILVNNAGINTEYPKMFIENTKEEVESILGVNCRATTLLTHAILPAMIHKRNGLIINISSLFGFLSSPLLAAYSGTKNYMDAFSLSLSDELRGSGVSVFCSLPGFVISNMSKLKRTSLTVISADSCVRTILKQAAAGHFVIACPHWTHEFIGWALSTIVPQSLRVRILGDINRGTNRAALRKAAKMAVEKQ
jgi:17beta-estradiol 17-dehydrogenase / very-long-chain 3-oxoacyl-CoA reductase